MTQPTEIAGKELVGPLSLKDEHWREYEFLVEGDDQLRVYRIEKPVALYYRIGGTTHRVVDEDGVTHCVPTVGYLGCVLRWKAEPDPVSF